MEISPDYKQTDVGLIPQEWDVKELRQIGNLSKGKGLLKEDIGASGGVPAIPYTALYTDFSEVVDYGRFKWFVDDLEGTIVVDEPCVLIASSSNMEANTGKASALPGTRPVAVGREVIIFKTDHSAIFVSYLLSTAPYRKRTLVLARGTTIKHLYPATFENYKVAVPPIAEQLTITEALCDVDALLSGIDSLIAKKRDLKQAAMQQLLTGQTRLPGFKGEWEVKRLGDHVRFLKNGVNSRAELAASGSIKYLHYGDIHVASGVFLDPSSLPCLSEEKARLLDRLADGDLVFVDASEDMDGVGKAVEIIGASHSSLVAGLHTIAARFDPSILANGFKAYLQFCPPFRRHLRRLAAGTKVYATNRRHIATVEMPLPSPKEQIAIASVLSDMDAELTALEARRDKTRALKQGMMQELLTGKTRLV